MTLAAGSDTAAIRLEVGYSITWYPEAEEVFIMRRGGVASGGSSSVLDKGTQLDADSEGELGRDPRSLRRSKGQIRRYCTANGCNVLLSSTYSDDHLDRASSRETVELDVRNLVRFMRRRWGRFPYVSMPEVQPERSEAVGEAVYNGMVLVPRLPRAVFDAVIDSWPYGQGDGYNGIDVTPWRDKRGGAQYAAKALSQYGAKQFGEAPPGRQAYRVGQGYQPRREVGMLTSSSSWSAVDLVEHWSEHRGFQLSKVLAINGDDGVAIDAAWGQW